MRLKEQIANFFTLLNLVSGVAGIMFLMYDYLYIACILVFAGAVFDFFDGMVARALKITSELGKQLDSLCDMVTFGVLPGLIAMTLLRKNMPEDFELLSNIEFVAILIPVFSAYRLAKFNIDTRQTTDFIGMPTPANAILWASVALSELELRFGASTNLTLSVSNFLESFIANNAFITAAIFVTAFLLVSPIRLFGFKFKKFQWKGNEMKFILAILAVALFFILGIVSIPIIIVLYILFSIIHFYILRYDEV